MSRPDGFSYRATKAGEVFISWSGKHVVTLRGVKAKRFLAQIRDVTDEQAQMVMARVTGNFKRGNER
jgi:hypothetical protein